LNAHVDDNRFHKNDNLNYISGGGTLKWDWKVGDRWFGDVGADYKRALADFANDQFLDKDW